MTGVELDPRAATDGTVLVVDGDILVRLAVADYLRDCGYRVFEAASGREAVTVLSAPYSVDVVLCDAEIPGEPTGFGLAKWMRDEHPEIRMILVGDIESQAEAAADLCDDGPKLSRPYDPQRVVDRIRRLMGGRAGAKPEGRNGASVQLA